MRSLLRVLLVSVLVAYLYDHHRPLLHRMTPDCRTNQANAF